MPEIATGGPAFFPLAPRPRGEGRGRGVPSSLPIHLTFMSPIRYLSVAIYVSIALSGWAVAPGEKTPGDLALDDYFRAETTRLETAAFAGIVTRADWEARREVLR